jgi:hypothetical protein
MDNINNAVAELVDLLDKKSKLFDTIMEITLEQKKDMDENAANNIEKLVNQKQSIIESVDEIDKSFSEKLNLMKRELKVNTLEEIDFSKYPEMKNLKLKVVEIVSVAQDIMGIEESNKKKLIVLMNGLKKEINQINAGKKSIKAYEKPNINNDGIYIDKKK